MGGRVLRHRGRLGERELGGSSRSSGMGFFFERERELKEKETYEVCMEVRVEDIGGLAWRDVSCGLLRETK